MYDNNLPFDAKDIKIYCEFEYSLRTALKKYFLIVI